ncbi:MAG TPA: GNVR domain-containing protein, partial [Pseudogracilibacillus sp.]|nr:GNVR domain-containing protein [Pseudogracilibacillus sp.]
VSVKDPDPQLATTIANTTVEVFQAEIVDIMNVDNVSVLSEAEMDLSPSPVEPRPTLNIAIALVLGAMIGVGIAFLLEYFDTTIRTEEDLEEKLGITIIGTVSTIDASDVQGGQRSRATNVNPTQPNEGRRSHAKAE